MNLRIATLLLLLLGSSSCAPEAPPPELPPRPVRALRLRATETARQNAFSGTARASVEARISFRVSGTVSRVAVEVGDTIESTDLIAELDPTDFVIALDEAKAALKQAEAEDRNAQSNLVRIRGGYENNSNTLQDYENALAQAEAASAAVLTLAKRVEAANSNLEYTKLRAPVSGAISAVEIEENENARAGQTIVELSSGSLSEVHVSVPERFIASISQGDEVIVTFDALPERTFEARVKEVGIATDSAGTYPVTCQLERPAAEIRAGMAATVRFRAEDYGQKRLVIPANSTRQETDGLFVFVAKGSGSGDEGSTAKVSKKAVTTGRLFNSGLEVLEGLDEGELLITAGVKFLDDGATVRLDPDWITNQ